MERYAIVIKEETGLCCVGTGTNHDYYKSIGMKKRDVTLSELDGQWYLTEKCPHKSEEQKAQEAKEKKIEELKQALDELDLKSIRALRAKEQNFIDKYELEAQELRSQLVQLTNE